MDTISAMINEKVWRLETGTEAEWDLGEHDDDEAEEEPGFVLLRESDGHVGAYQAVKWFPAGAVLEALVKVYESEIDELSVVLEDAV